MLKNVSPLNPAPQPLKQIVHRHRVDDGAIDRLASAVEAMAAVFLRSSSRHASRPRLMSYEEASEVTTLKRSKLESMLQNGRFREGRHYVKEGGRVLFHYNLPDLMFEDKLLLADDDGSGSTDSTAPERTPAKKPLSRPSRSGRRINLDY